MNENTVKYLILRSTPGFGNISVNRLLRLCGNINVCFEAVESDILSRDAKMPETERIGQKKLRIFLAYRNSGVAENDAKKLIERSLSGGCGIITTEDNTYPKRFQGICEMPTVLFLRGELRINEYERSVGIVGARRCSQEGKEEAIRRAELEVVAGSVVISGMAKGIDSYAHTAVIKNGGYTIAVLGSGPDICYPREHEKLYGEIIKNGCIVSEYPPGTLPRNYTFPARNRLIAALSDEIVVIDAGAHSGTESTVRAAVKFGRMVESI
ncbi:MAG: DNA-protecting protein DprA [Lachnospiraceae bacterium]|nr:DNA-protecting protein DprA [Lachnospiraceae bacterium]